MAAFVMQLVNIAICDDDSRFRESLLHTIKNKLPTPCAFFQFADGAELLRSLEQRQCVIDLVLLDVRMPRMDGIETAHRIRELHKGAVIILITSYSEYVYEGYDVRAFHFLTKPVEDAKLFPILSDAIRQVEESRADYLAVNKQGECVYIPLQEIHYIESLSRKLIVHTNAEPMEYYGKLSELEAQLAPKNFCRVHHSYLVNLNAVRRVDKAGLWVELRNGGKLEVSRRRVHGLLLQLMGSL